MPTCPFTACVLLPENVVLDDKKVNPTGGILTSEYIRENGIELRDALLSLTQFIESNVPNDKRACVAFHNANFDVPTLNNNFILAGYDEGLPPCLSQVICSLEIAKTYMFWQRHRMALKPTHSTPSTFTMNISRFGSHEWFMYFVSFPSSFLASM